jgi:hypothetical protein
MTRSYAPRSRRLTQPLRVVRYPRDPAIDDLGFTCFRLVPSPDGLAPIELVASSARMFAFVGR